MGGITRNACFYFSAFFSVFLVTEESAIFRTSVLYFPSIHASEKQPARRTLSVSCAYRLSDALFFPLSLFFFHFGCTMSHDFHYLKWDKYISLETRWWRRRSAERGEIASISTRDTQLKSGDAEEPVRSYALALVRKDKVRKKHEYSDIRVCMCLLAVSRRLQHVPFDTDFRTQLIV